MSQKFSFEFEWLPREYGSAAEQCTFGELRILADGVVLTELDDRQVKTVRRGMRASAYHPALWLAANWWRLRWEPERSDPDLDWRMSHVLSSAGGGYLWPTVSFSSDGNNVRVTCVASSGDAFPVRYLNSADVHVPAQDFESGVDRFIESVIARLSDQGAGESDLATLWQEVLWERRDPELANLRKLEALLGFDPDDSPDDLLDRLVKLADLHGRAAIEELAAACCRDTILKEIEGLVSCGPVTASQIRLPEYARIRKHMFEHATGDHVLPWQQAEVAAHLVRRSWGIGRGPFLTVPFSRMVGLSPASLTGLPADSSGGSMSVGFRDPEHPECVGVALHRKPLSSRRFALARIIGDHFIAPGTDRLLPATPSFTSRQKFQRAFAQELLCPFDDLMEAMGTSRPDDDAIEDVAAMFEVSPLLVRTTLVNKGVLQWERLG